MYEDLTYTINGCLFTVYNTLGNVWNEEVYEKATQTEAQSRGLKAERQKEYEVFYFDRRVGHYRVDLLIDDKVIVELKAVPEILSLHHAQLISYLKGYNKRVGILANFGGTSMQHQTFPNRLEQKKPLKDHFDYDKIRLKEKEKIRDLLFMANRVLVTLGTARNSGSSPVRSGTAPSRPSAVARVPRSAPSGASNMEHLARNHCAAAIQQQPNHAQHVAWRTFPRDDLLPDYRLDFFIGHLGD